MGPPGLKERKKVGAGSLDGADGPHDSIFIDLDSVRMMSEVIALQMDSLRRAAARDETRHDDRHRPGPL